MRQVVVTFLIAIISSCTFAQQDSLYCKGLYIDPSIPFAKALDLTIMSQLMNCNFSGVNVVPVVVHVIHNGEPEGTGSNISETLILEQLELLNQAFRKVNVPPNLYPGIAADVGIEFQLARSSPNGMPHNGITRTHWTAAQMPYTKAYINNNIKPATIWDADRYLNIWTTTIDDDAGGYATFPANTGLGGQHIMNDDLGNYNTDGVVIDYHSVKHPLAYTFLIHEIGHYLGLLHTFEGTENCENNNGDYCDDTPKTKAHRFQDSTLCIDYYTCGIFTRNMTENFMDYSIPCHQIFTNDQKTRMIVSLNSPRRPDHLSYNTNEWHGLDTYEPNGSPATAANIFPTLSSTAVDSSVYSYIFHQNDYDWFKINISSAGTLTVSLDDLAVNYDLELYGAGGLSEWINGSYNTGTAAEQIVYSHASSSPDVLYVTTYGFNHVSHKCDDYRLRIQWSPAVSCTPISASILKTDLTSAGANDGSATVTVSAGASPYTYLWSNNATTAGISNLATGTYSVTVTGNDGCTATRSVFVGVQGVQQPYCYGTTTLTAASGTFSDGSGSSFYANNSNCSWRIDPSVNNATVTLWFSAFQLAAGDTVTVYDGSNSNAPVLAKFYGNSIPPQIVSTGATMFVAFTANGSDTLQGFTAHYTSQILSTGTSIVQYEYWFDNDYANRQLFNITPRKVFDLNTDIPLAGLANGLHTLHIRFKDDNNKWSSVLSSFFVKYPSGNEPAKSIAGYEYWFDNDYTNKATQTVSHQQVFTLNAGLDVADLSDGLHTLHIRFKDNGGFWSSVLSSFFIKYPSGNDTTKSIAAYEYWFDNDYANKVTQAVSPQKVFLLNTGLDVANLSHGLHTLHIRFKDDGDFFSSVLSQFFIKYGNQTADDNVVVAYRYWFDMDVANITTALLPSPVKVYDLIANISTGGLTNGMHTVHFQFKDSIGLWSGVTNDTFNMVVAPTALFTASDTVLCRTGNVSFTNQSINANSYQWSFGDGGTSTATNPAHTYTSQGLYTVRLIAISTTSGLRDTLTRTQYIRVVEPNVTVSPNTSVCPGSSATLTANGAATYFWYPSNGLNTTSQQTVIATPANTTTYNVIGTDQYGCKDTASVTVSVSNTVNVGVTQDTAICEGSSVTLTANGADTYMWSPSAGLNTTAGISVIASPTVATTYKVVGTASCGKDSAYVTVTVHPLPTASAGNNVTICKGDTTTLMASGGNAYLWNTNETSASISVSPIATTAYTVTVSDNNNCSASASVTVTVNSSLVVTLNDTTICVGGVAVLDAGGSGTSYLWSNNETTQTISVSDDDTYSVTVTFANSCSAVASATVTVAANLPVSLADKGYCPNDSALLDAGFAGATYLWSGGATTQTIHVTAGVYSVTVTAASGCSGSDTATVYEHPPVTAFAGNDEIICLHDTAALQASGGVFYSWSNGIASDVNAVSPPQTTSYAVTVTDQNGCTGSDTVSVFVNGLPAVALDSLGTVCINVPPFALSGGTPAGGIYTGSGISNNTLDVTAAGLGTHTITYTYTDGNGCTASAQSHITVDVCSGIAAIPNQPEVQIFPNPTTGEVNIFISSATAIGTAIEIFNSIGQSISKENYAFNKELKTKYDLSLLAAGVYVFKISCGEAVNTYRVVLER